MNALQWSQHFSHYKYMGISPDDQWQLTPQSLVWSGQNMNPSEIFFFKPQIKIDFNKPAGKPDKPEILMFQSVKGCTDAGSSPIL